MKELLFAIFIVVFGFSAYGIERAIYCAAGLPLACAGVAAAYGEPTP